MISTLSCLFYTVNTINRIWLSLQLTKKTPVSEHLLIRNRFIIRLILYSATGAFIRLRLDSINQSKPPRSFPLILLRKCHRKTWHLACLNPQRPYCQTSMFKSLTVYSLKNISFKRSSSFSSFFPESDI